MRFGVFLPLWLWLLALPFIVAFWVVYGVVWCIIMGSMWLIDRGDRKRLQRGIG